MLPNDHAAALALLETGADLLSTVPSVARVRAAVILLEGITDDVVTDVVAPDLDRLRDVLDHMDDGTL